jgi:hypothetical protein
MEDGVRAVHGSQIIDPWKRSAFAFTPNIVLVDRSHASISSQGDDRFFRSASGIGGQLRCRAPPIGVSVDGTDGAVQIVVGPTQQAQPSIMRIMRIMRRKRHDDHDDSL